MSGDETTLQAPDSEAALIGIAGHHPDAIASVLRQLDGAAFYDPARGIVWDACRHLADEREIITPVTVGRHLVATKAWTSATQRVVQTEMANAHPAHTADRHAHLVADLDARRALARAVKRAELVTYTHPGDTSEAVAAVRAAFDDLDGPDIDSGNHGTRSWAQMLDEFEEAHAPGAPQGIPTPWWELDQLIGGLFPGRMYVIGGAPGDGKSTGALNIALDAAANNHPTLVFSKEMPVVDVFGRLVARGAEVDLRTINRRGLDDLQRHRIREYARKAGPRPLWVNADPGNLAAIKSIARGHHHRHGLEVLVVDYLQLVSAGDARTAEEEVARVSTGLKNLAMELGCAVVVPAQLNRAPTARADQRPTKSDLRSSGKIEQDADVVVLLWHQKVDGQPTGQVTFIVDKNRHGPKGDIDLRWHGGYGAIG